MPTVYVNKYLLATKFKQQAMHMQRFFLKNQIHKSCPQDPHSPEETHVTNYKNCAKKEESNN